MNKCTTGRLGQEVGQELEQAASRERYISFQLEQQLASYRDISHQLARLREQLRQAAASSGTKTQRLLEMTDQLEMVKMEMENRGSWMLDGQNEMLAQNFNHFFRISLSEYKTQSCENQERNDQDGCEDWGSRASLGTNCFERETKCTNRFTT